MTVVAQGAKAPGMNCCVAGSIPAVTPRDNTNKKNALQSIKEVGQQNVLGEQRSICKVQFCFIVI